MTHYVSSFCSTLNKALVQNVSSLKHFSHAPGVILDLKMRMPFYSHSLWSTPPSAHLLTHFIMLHQTSCVYHLQLLTKILTEWNVAVSIPSLFSKLLKKTHIYKIWTTKNISTYKIKCCSWLSQLYKTSIQTGLCERYKVLISYSFLNNLSLKNQLNEFWPKLTAAILKY